ncbi:MAG: phosphatidate cytidylyltransferase [Cycloclasticus sp.]|nr:phosphatidate cytidylyltransferase [Cycloclasticus sp.]MBQ0789034.1 phosphatidate cytidylyltransferase [Cycloclasticus sp.]
MNSLFKRVLTAAVLIPLVVWLVLFSSELAFSVVLSLVSFTAAYEWFSLCGVNNRIVKGLLATLCLVLALGISYSAGAIVYPLIHANAFIWLLIVMLIILQAKQLLDISISRFITIMFGLFIVSLMFVSLLQIRLHFEQGPALLMYLLLLIWTADSGAYFVGRAFGRRKLSVFISPGKSIEGVLGGLICCLFLAVLASYYFSLSNARLAFVGVSLFVAFVSVYGDLFESLMKRRAKVKDSGNILPGHGGALDRLDSLIAAGPVFLSLIVLAKLF